MSAVNVAIVGANGYSGEELCTLLSRHPGIRIVAVSSRTHAGRPVTDVLPRLAGSPAFAGLSFCDSKIDALLASGAEYFFLALPHGLATEFALPLVEAGKRVIDLSADFRLRDAGVYEEFYGDAHPAPGSLAGAVYGLPELHRQEIRTAKLVASAGCYPTSILLPLVPLLRAGLIAREDIVVSSASGVSGAGRKADVTLLYAECNESLRAYGLPKHRHLSEIEQELSLAAGAPIVITFVPHLAPMTRGIHTTTFVRLAPGVKPDQIAEALSEAYANEPFVRVRESLPDTKNVTGTNFCDIAVRFDDRAKRLILLSAEDNLVKGAAGQAVQNFNLMAGFDEATALL
ncbi:MAG TPA: N-acetyl-gamma-glutamyl-phosphate reductase [Chthoniobacterales bacterium]